MTLMKDRLQQALQESGLSKKALADAVGVSASSVSQWLSGESKSISSERVFLAARALGVSPEWLATGKLPVRAGEEVRRLDIRGWVPIIQWDMASNPDLERERPAEKAPYITGGERTFALRIEGDSMDGREESFRAGELIHVDPDDIDVESGSFVVARLLQSDRNVFRQLLYDGAHPYLKALNPGWPHSSEPFEILGRVVARSQIL